MQKCILRLAQWLENVENIQFPRRCLNVMVPWEFIQFRDMCQVWWKCAPSRLMHPILTPPKVDPPQKLTPWAVGPKLTWSTMREGQVSFRPRFRPGWTFSPLVGLLLFLSPFIVVCVCTCWPAACLRLRDCSPADWNWNVLFIHKSLHFSR